MTNISNSLRIFLADTTAITLAIFCLILISWILFSLTQMRAKLARNEKRFAMLEKEIGGFSEKK